MTIASKSTPQKGRQMAAGIAARAAQVVIVFALQGILLFAIAGRIDWTWAWVFLGIYAVSMAVNSTFLLRRSPEMVAERGTGTFVRGWDKVLSAAWGVAQFLAIPVVAALDIRLGWSGSVALGWHIAGGILFAAGLALFGWSMIANAYFSTTVRVQDERGHTVCRSGPYRFVRHPGYSGTLLQSLGMPLLLGSWWALVPGALAAAAMIARTVFEDRMLRAELAGYADFAGEVHYRLVPRIW